MTYSALCSEIDTLHAAGERERLFGLVRLLALRVLEHDEDAAQDATIDVWQCLKTFRGRCQFHTWAKRVIKAHRAAMIRERIAEQQNVELTDEVANGPSELHGRDVSVQFPNETASQVFQLKAAGYDLREIARMAGVQYGSLRNLCTEWRKKIIVTV
ncbi:MAG TPA: sigma factor [Terracidiphilus sp.]|nr:sigma factor [Terracidiphilus sp.]